MSYGNNVFFVDLDFEDLLGFTDFLRRCQVHAGIRPQTRAYNFYDAYINGVCVADACEAAEAAAKAGGYEEDEEIL